MKTTQRWREDLRRDARLAAQDTRHWYGLGPNVTLDLLDDLEEALAVVRMFQEGDGCFIGCYRHQDGTHSPACAAACALLGEAPKQEKSAPAWHEGMRAYQPATCWWYTAENVVCILERGHDGGTHEPEEKGEQT